MVKMRLYRDICRLIVGVWGFAMCAVDYEELQLKSGRDTTELCLL